MHKLALLSLSAFLVVGATDAQAKGMKWMPADGLPAGAQMAVVKGDPSKAGSDFIIRLKTPANYTVPPHHHPTDETVRVLSAGTLSYGMGDKVDQSSAGSLAKGYHVTMQANMNHWASATDPLEIQVNGTGPFAIVYVNPADDPRNAKK